MKLQGLYPILDAEMAAARGHDLVACARGFAGLGLEVQQLRAKTLSGSEFLRLAERLREVVPCLIINDRVDVALVAGAAGVHLGQDDLPLAAAQWLAPLCLGRSRWSLGEGASIPGQGRPQELRASPSCRQRLAPPGWVVGVSTHNLEQAQRAAAEGPGYLAVGPIFATSSKLKPDPVVGVQTLSAVRQVYAGPLAAIGGIQLDNCEGVWGAGADAVAVISALWRAEAPVEAARQFLLAFARVSCHSPEKSPEKSGEATPKQRRGPTSLP